MENILIIISAISFLLFLVGLINPRLVIRWGSEEKKTRLKVTFIFLPIAIIFLYFFIQMSDLRKEIILNQRRKQEKLAQEERELEKEFILTEEFFESSKAKLDMKASAIKSIQKIEQEKILDLQIADILFASSVPTRDLAGNYYPHHVSFSGIYKGTNTNGYQVFAMTFAYDTAKDVQSGNSKCLQYFNIHHGEPVNHVDPEYDVLSSLLKLNEEGGIKIY